MKLISKTRRGKERIISIFGMKFRYRKVAKMPVVENVFDRSFKNKVLLSYITAPFTKGLFKKHTNRLECYTAAQIFDELGYQVDVIEFKDTIPSYMLEQYVAVYGFGKSFITAVSNPNIKAIYYGTGACTKYSNPLTVQKVIDFYNTHGAWCPASARLNDSASEIMLNYASMIIPLGNSFVADTYKVSGIKQNIRNVNCFYYDACKIDVKAKDFSKVKRNFLWFGSVGALHKGLDIVIDVFKKRPDINLTIAGANLREEEFYNYYKDVFDGKVSNIKYYDFVDIESDDFKKLMTDHAAVVFPSVSEGGAPAVLNVMANGGLVPIISKSCGLDVEQYGFMFDNIRIEDVEKKIDDFLALSEDDVSALSAKVESETRQLYSYENYKNNLKEIISSIVKPA